MIAQLDPIYIKARYSKVFSRLLSYGLFEGRPVTTRGRWINPVVFALFALERRLPQLKQVEQPIFILGTGRSGTTVLGLVLSMHRQVGFLNEPKALWHMIHPEEDIIGNYSRGAARYRLTAADATAAVCQTAQRLFGVYLAMTFSQRIVDKYPELIFRVPFVRAIFPDAHFLFLVRNGWDTCHSIAGWSAQFGRKQHTEQHDWWGVNRRKWHLLVEQVVAYDDILGRQVDVIKRFERHIDLAAVEWIVTMREGLRLMQELPHCVHMLRYEDLTASPEAVLADIWHVCALPPDAKALYYAQEILHPVPSKAPLALSPSIRPAFEETMSALGYRRGI